jgi:hypothetical protein
LAKKASSSLSYFPVQNAEERARLACGGETLGRSG